MLTFTLFATVLLATQAVATDIDTARTSIYGLLHSRSVFARQISPSDIPAGCQSQCAGTVAVLNSQTCVTASCLCTETVNKGFQTCLTCVAAGDPALTAQAQDAIAQYEDACTQSGIPVSSLAIGSGGAVSTNPASSPAIPTGGASQTPSVFFSSSATGGALPNSTPGVATPTRSIITASPVGTGSSPAVSVSTTPIPLKNGAIALPAVNAAVAGLVAVAGGMLVL